MRALCLASFARLASATEGYFSIFKRGMIGVYQHCSDRKSGAKVARDENHRFYYGCRGACMAFLPPDTTGVREETMVRRFDHMTIAVADLDRARRFFGLLGFKEAISVVIAGEPFTSYMGVPGIAADHVTLVLENASPRTEIQLLHYRHPEPVTDPHIRDLHKIGFNHICFATDDIAAEIAKMRENGFDTRSDILDFHSRKLAFLDGPEGVVVELSQWHG